MKYGILLAGLFLSGCAWMTPNPSGFIDKKIETEHLLTFSIWEKEGIEKGIKKGQKEGIIISLSDLVKDGLLPISEAAKRAGMSIKAFKTVAGIK